MKQLFFIYAFIIFCFSSIHAQTKNVNVDNFRFNVTYKTFPSQPQDPLFFYYTTQINASKSIEKNVSLEEVQNAISIGSQKKAEDPSQASMLVSVQLGNLVIESSSVSERVVENKDRDGKITSIDHYYKVEVRYSFDSSFEIKQGEKSLLKSSVYTKSSPQYYVTDEYGSSKAASDYWNNNREMLIIDFMKNLSLKTAYTATNTASARYGFPVVRTSDIIKTIDEKKHNENEKFRAAANALKEELESMTPETPMNRERIDGLIQYFKGIPEQYKDTNLKADIRLRYAAYYNLCKIYIYLDEPDNVVPYANLILENGHDKDDCKKMLKISDELKKDLDLTSVKSRHFDPEIYFN